jgi:hypothetical protein
MNVGRFLLLSLLCSVAPVALAQWVCYNFPKEPCYEPPANLESRMSVREARKLVRTVGSPSFFYAAGGNAASTTAVRYSYGGFVLQGARPNETAKVEYATMVHDPYVVTINTLHGRLATLSAAGGAYLIGYKPNEFQNVARIVDAITVLRRAARREHGGVGDELFAKIAEEYRSKPKPEIGADLRGAMTQVQAAVQAKNFDEAIDLLSDVVARAPWWPVGRWNLAIALAETGDTPSAVHHMKRFIALVPEGPDTKAARELIAGWGG